MREHLVGWADVVCLDLDFCGIVLLAMMIWRSALQSALMLFLLTFPASYFLAKLQSNIL